MNHIRTDGLLLSSGSRIADPSRIVRWIRRETSRQFPGIDPAQTVTNDDHFSVVAAEALPALVTAAQWSPVGNQRSPKYRQEDPMTHAAQSHRQRIQARIPGHKTRNQQHLGNTLECGSG